MPLSFSLPLFPAILLALALIVIVYLLLHATKLKTGEQSFTRQIEDLNQQIITLQQANATLQRDLQQNINEQITLKTALNAREVKLAELINEQHSLQQSFDKLQQEKNLLTADKAALVAQLQAQKSLQAESSRREEVARHELEARLQQWGQKMLQERGVALNKQSAEQLNNVVGPLTEELKQFRSQLTLNQKIQSEQAGSLKTELTK